MVPLVVEDDGHTGLLLCSRCCCWLALRDIMALDGWQFTVVRIWQSFQHVAAGAVFRRWQQVRHRQRRAALVVLQYEDGAVGDGERLDSMCMCTVCKHEEDGVITWNSTVGHCDCKMTVPYESAMDCSGDTVCSRDV